MGATGGGLTLTKDFFNKFSPDYDKDAFDLVTIFMNGVISGLLVDELHESTEGDSELQLSDEQRDELFTVAKDQTLERIKEMGHKKHNGLISAAQNAFYALGDEGQRELFDRCLDNKLDQLFTKQCSETYSVKKFDM